jgi:hypothetical protein
MSKGNGLHRLYDQLDPGERFRLDVLAMARGDSIESDRLTRTCPRFTYTMNDRAFTGRWLGAMDMTLRVYVELAGYLDRLKTLDVVRVILPYSETFAEDAAFESYLDGHRAGARHAWAAAGAEGPAPEWPLEVDEESVKAPIGRAASILPEILEKIERELAAEALTLWEAFAGFCESEMGLDAEKVVGVVMGVGEERVEVITELAERLSLEPDEELVAELGKGLAESWSIVVGRG